MQATSARIVNNIILPPITDSASPGFSQANTLEAKTNDNRMKHLFIVPCSVAVSPVDAPEKNFEDKIGFEVL
jgi:hypothetical protein